MEKIKVGVIGTGSISHLHIGAYLANPAVELYALCDIDEPRLKEVSQKYGVERIFTDHRQMLRLEELDAVSVCTWNSAHARVTVDALEAGKHVLCEKPMAVNAVEALRMKRAGDKAGKLLMIGFVRRFGNDCRVLQDCIGGGFLGEIYYAKASYLRRHGNPGGWFGNKARSGGGPLIDLGVHVLDLTRYLMGNPEPVSVYGAVFDKLNNRAGIKNSAGYRSDAAQADDASNVEDFASAMIRYGNGAVLSMETSFCLNLKQDEGAVQLFGTRGGARLSPELELYTDMNGYMTNVQLTIPTALSFDGLFAAEIDHFVDCVMNKTACKAPAEDGVAAMRILDAIYRSAESGHEVTLEEGEI